MGFSISYDAGVFGALAMILLVAVGVIVAAWLFTAAKDAHDEVLEDDQGTDLKW